MKHLIIGTAGHIDHGKTTLIRAITGRNTDRLKEEQKRGISIELGFTYFDLPSGQRAGIIDVPGHERFIKNMLAGVGGIDIVLLVVAADEGMMPQTLEHLHILNLLGTKKGFVVITKSDLVEDDWIDLVEEEIMESTMETFLEDTPIIRVSSTEGKGMEEVIELIDKLATELSEKESEDMPRLPVDRVFTIAGFGTVVTGTLLSGQLKVGDEVQIFPGNKIGRIRTLQVHDEDANLAYGGQRVAINLAGIKMEEVDRGSVIAPIDSMKSTMMLDVKVKLLKSLDRPIANRTRLKLYIGTKEVICRLILLDRDELHPGEETYGQLRLEEEIVAKREDKFILRFYSPMFTIGGGEILDPNPRKRKRFDDEALEELEIKEEGSTKDIIEQLVESRGREFLSVKEIASYSAMSEENLKKELNKLVEEEKIIILKLTKDLYPIHLNTFNRIKDNISEALELYHQKFPLRLGIQKEEIRSRFLKGAKPRIAEQLIEILIERQFLEQKLDTLTLKGFKIEFNEEQLKIKNDIKKHLLESRFLPPKREEIFQHLKHRKEETDEVISAMINNGEIIRINEEVFLLKEIYEEGVNILLNHFKDNTSISVGEFRDLIDTNRRVALGLLEYFDQARITKRDGDKRIINNQ